MRGNLGKTATALAFTGFFGLIGMAILAKPFITSDYCAHLSVIRAIAASRPLSDIPLTQPDLHRLHDPIHILLGLLMRYTGISGTTVMSIGGVFNTAIFFLGTFILARSLGPRRTLPLAMLMTFLFIWGEGYRWSNEYPASILPIVGPYPSTLAWGVSFIVLALYHSWSRQGGWWRLLAAMLLTGFVTIQHALTAMMFTSWFPILWVWMGRMPWRRRLTLALIVVAGLALSLLWPYTNFLRQLRMAVKDIHLWSMTSRSSDFLQPTVALLALGPAWAGIFFLWLTPKAWRKRLLAFMLIYGVLWIGCSFAGLRLSHRFVFFLGFTLQLSIAGALARGAGLLIRRGIKRQQRLALWLAMVALLFIPWFPFHFIRATSPIRQRLDWRHCALRPSEYARYETLAGELNTRIGADAAVLMDYRTARLMASMGGPMLVDGGMVVKRSPGIRTRGFSSLDADYIAFVRRRRKATGAEYLLLNPKEVIGRSALMQWETQRLHEFGELTNLPGDFILVRFNTNASQETGVPDYTESELGIRYSLTAAMN